MNQIIKHKNKYYFITKQGYKEIIATTDLNLNTPITVDIIVTEGKDAGLIKSLPQIPLDFIKHYISEYNKGNVISSIEVEYEADMNNTPYKSNKHNNALKCLKESANIECKLKINQDNTINISIVEEYSTQEGTRSFDAKEFKVKKSIALVEEKLYTRNEVEQLIRTFDMQLGRDVETVKFDNWIKENL